PAFQNLAVAQLQGLDDLGQELQTLLVRLKQVHLAIRPVQRIHDTRQSSPRTNIKQLLRTILRDGIRRALQWRQRIPHNLHSQLIRIAETRQVVVTSTVPQHLQKRLKLVQQGLLVSRDTLQIRLDHFG